MTSKTCFVRLNRNFLNSIGTIKGNSLAVVERKNSEGKVEYFAKNPNSCGESSHSEFSEEESSIVKDTTQENVGKKKHKLMSEVRDGNSHKLRTKKVKYLTKSPNSCSETLHSELSEEEGSTDEETRQEKVGKEKYKSVSKVIDENNYKLRKKGDVDYFPESSNSHSETSHSEFSNEESCTDEETTQDKDRRKKHKVLKTKVWKKLICLHCDKSFSTYNSYSIHKNSLLSKQFKCIVCNTNQKERQSFVNHMKKYHPEVKPFLCNYRRCEKNFKTQKHLEIHKRTHFKFMCKYCKKLFARKHFMRKHVLKIH